MLYHLIPFIQHLFLSLQATVQIVLSIGISLTTQLLQSIFVNWLLQQWADRIMREANSVTIHLEEEVNTEHLRW
jgi:hypothetical protein